MSDRRFELEADATEKGPSRSSRSSVSATISPALVEDGEVPAPSVTPETGLERTAAVAATTAQDLSRTLDPGNVATCTVDSLEDPDVRQQALGRRLTILAGVHELLTTLNVRMRGNLADS